MNNGQICTLLAVKRAMGRAWLPANSPGNARLCMVMPGCLLTALINAAVRMSVAGGMLSTFKSFNSIVAKPQRVATHRPTALHQPPLPLQHFQMSAASETFRLMDLMPVPSFTTSSQRSSRWRQAALLQCNTALSYKAMQWQVAPVAW